MLYIVFSTLIAFVCQNCCQNPNIAMVCQNPCQNPNIELICQKPNILTIFLDKNKLVEAVA